MKRIHTLGLLLILVIAPSLSIGMTLPTIDAGSAPAENVVIPVGEDVTEDNVELNAMFFTETPTSESGLYYVCRQGVDTIAYFGKSSVMYLSGDTVFTLEFPGSTSVVPQGESPTGSFTNYLMGSDSSQWKTGVEDCAVLRYSELYPGIDLVYKIQDSNLKYDFIVAPNANPNLIQMSYPDTSSIDVNDAHVTVTNSKSSFSDTGLWAFQESEEINNVDCSFDLLDSNIIGFDVGCYDETQVLTIDPILVYSTFLGGTSEDKGTEIVVEDGFIYVVGNTISSSFPVYNAYNSTYGGSSEKDCFITKFAPDGQTLIYSTFLGGEDGDYANGLAVENGFVYISGITESTTFPTFNGYDMTHNGYADGFVTKLAIDGQSLIYSTYLGSTSWEYTCYLAVESGYAYVTGRTQSANFPTTTGAYSESPNGDQEGFVTKINTTGSGLDYSSYLGGSGWDEGTGIAVEDGYAYVTGYTYSTNFPTINGYDLTANANADAYVTKVATDGATLVSSSYLGGSDTDYGRDIAVEDGFVYVTGFTGGTDFPVTESFDDQPNGGWDSFVVKLSRNLLDLVYGTLLGGTDDDRAYKITAENGYAYVTGYTYSDDFPTLNAYDSSHNGWIDTFVTKLGIDGRFLEFSTYLGGVNEDQGYGIAVENGTAFVTGWTNSVSYPTVDAYSETQSGSFDCVVSILSDDQDHDSLSDWHEGLYGTNPLASDSDVDGASDAYEIAEGTDPLDSCIYPGVASNSEYTVAYSSYLGGSSTDNLESVRVDNGYIYLAGKTSSADFPMVNAWNSTYSTSSDIFIVKMSQDGQSIIYSTFVGGIYGEAFEGMDVYDGCVFVGGYTNSPNFPTYLAYDSQFDGSNDAFIFKLAVDGSSLEFSTYLGGLGSEYIRDLCVEDGYAYVTGETSSTDFPMVNAYDSSIPVTWESFVTKFALDGQSLLYSSYLGGETNADYSYTISVSDGFAYVGGYTMSTDYPLVNAVDDTFAIFEATLTKFSRDGGSLVFSTFLGGSGVEYMQAISAEGEFVYLTGMTTSSDFPIWNALYDTKLGGGVNSAFVARMKSDGSTFVYCTYLTGTNYVVPTSITQDKGFVCVTGHTEATDFPITSGHTASCDGTSADAFVTKFAVDGQSLLYSSCIGGDDNDYGRSVDTYDGKVYLAGYTNSDNYYTLVGFDETDDIGTDGFLTIFDIDSDFDLFPDFTEGIVGTDLYAIDSDLDNFIDSYEFLYGSDPLDSGDYPAISQDLYDSLVANLAGNASLIQNLITWSDGNASLIETVNLQLADNTALLSQVITWLDGNHTAIETLFTALDGNASLLASAIADINNNEAQILVLAAAISGNSAYLNSLNTTHFEDFDNIQEAIDEIREVLDGLGISVGDADCDGLDDLDEVLYGTDLLKIDSDNDNLIDAFEIKLGTDPLDDDSDADLWLDGLEVIAGTNPLDPLSYPGAPQGDDSMIIVIVAGTIGVAGIVGIIAFKKLRRRS